MIKLIATRAFDLDGSGKLKKNVPFEVSTESIASLLVKTGRARYADDDDDKKRKYNRRDMRAAT